MSSPASPPSSGHLQSGLRITTTKAAALSINWSIDDLRDLECPPGQQLVASQLHQIDINGSATLWRLNLYPNGKANGKHEHRLSIYLCLKSAAVLPIVADITTTLTDRAPRHVQHVYQKLGALGLAAFDELPSGRQSICVEARLTVSSTFSKPSAPLGSTIRLDDRVDVLQLFDSEQLTDCEVLCGKNGEVPPKTFKAHRLVLYARSAKFRSHFADGSKNTIELPFTSASTLLFLRLLYGATMPTALLAAKADEIVRLAEYCEIDELRTACSAMLAASSHPQVKGVKRKAESDLDVFFQSPAADKLTDCTLRCVVTKPKEEGSSGAAEKIVLHAFSAHRAVLCAGSPVFNEKFEKCKNNNETIMDVENCEPDVMRLFLKEFYRHDIYDVELDEHAEALYTVADDHMMKSLRDRCEAHMSQRVNESNFTRFLRFADNHSAGALKNACFAYFKMNRVEAMQSERFDPVELGRELTIALIGAAIVE